MVRDKPPVLYVDDLPLNIKLFEATFRKDYNLIQTEFSSEVLKILGRTHAPVFYFNILIIWIMTFILSFFLRFRLLKKSIEFFGKPWGKMSSGS